MKRLLIPFVCCLLLGSCESSKRPEGLLSEDKMVNVLIDIHLTEGIVSSLPVAYDSSKVLYSLLEKDILKKHQVEDSVFTQSMLYYLQDPSNMEDIYARVVDSLVVRESSEGKLDLF
ncbi:DUF4296 domain-containing protein [Algoriphagus halophytocola]|uniref:DUF4296 domain-containing protein n=1 Tax=Algoriphagus halophytocola TaxID=2991499 RepID=A0ABY6MFF8_9BACT|nr:MULTISPECIES: DUF4296 domain-containing protein [unclassified Algoriphagus]UZD22550.1 DUF4296 domain-containing protein [Algoriphagus sp. TR-M5]WBL43813.1 DUF4296 domain-containing protein [Algoriphagus sp. TR-M9]